MPMLVQVILAGALIGGFVWWAMNALGTGVSRGSKCADCVHCRKLFRDGTLCGFGAREVFKNEVQVNNCVDHRARVGGKVSKSRS